MKAFIFLVGMVLVSSAQAQATFCDWEIDCNVKPFGDRRQGLATTTDDNIAWVRCDTRTWKCEDWDYGNAKACLIDAPRNLMCIPVNMKD
jgi:hypothetical protein